MFLDEHTLKDMPYLPVGHKFHWLEKALKSADSGIGLNKKDIHDKEHEDQLIYWKCDPKHSSKLTIRKDENDVAFADRLYHIMLHLKYWKETSQHQNEARIEAYKRFEAESGFDLDNLTIPKASAPGHDAY
jgi:hypothetical protein